MYLFRNGSQHLPASNVCSVLIVNLKVCFTTNKIIVRLGRGFLFGLLFFSFIAHEMITPPLAV